MAKITIPCLVGKPNKAGITSWYWQPSKTLRDAGFEPEALGKNEARAFDRARELNRQVELWKAGGLDRTDLARRRQTGTFSALVQRYRKEYLEGKKPDGSPRLRPSTRENYSIFLELLEQWAGKHPVAYITPARVKALRDRIARPIERDEDGRKIGGGLGHSSAFNLLRVLRQVMAFAESEDIIPKGSNPATNFGLAKPPARRSIWSVEDEAAFIAAAHDLGRPSMALAAEIAEFTAQRESDLIKFTEPQFGPLEILDPLLHQRLADSEGVVWGWTLQQGKTSDEYSARMMQIPFTPALAAKISAALRTNRARDRAAEPPRLVTHVVVDDKTGLPWGQNRFQKEFRKIRDHAAERTGRPEMTKLTWHDWRRTRVVRLRRRGMGKEMIASITGHDHKSIDEMLKVYGPIDPTITAAAIASMIPVDDKPVRNQNPSNKTG